MRGFLGHGRPAGKVAVVRHDRDALRERILRETGSDPAAVHEHTGVYGHVLERYLDAIGMRRYAISPLESAKVRKSMVRPTKNDSLDCTTIAEVYYLRDVRVARTDGGTYGRLREMSRHYRYLLGLKVIEKGRYFRCLDDVWPGFDEVVGPFSEKSLAVVAHYGHPSGIRSVAGVMAFLDNCLIKIASSGEIKITSSGEN